MKELCYTNNAIYIAQHFDSIRHCNILMTKQLYTICVKWTQHSYHFQRESSPYYRTPKGYRILIKIIIISSTQNYAKLGDRFLPLSCPSIRLYILLSPNTLRKYQDAELTLYTHISIAHSTMSKLIEWYIWERNTNIIQSCVDIDAWKHAQHTLSGMVGYIVGKAKPTYNLWGIKINLLASRYNKANYSVILHVYIKIKYASVHRDYIIIAANMCKMT